MTIAFAGKGRNTHLRREGDRDAERGAKKRKEHPLSPLFHLSFDWTVIVICGPHYKLVKGSGTNKWCNYTTLI